ncbi:MAG: MBL fold metallo-hydrolase [Nannocystaceae bacterium]|nr:MBL fold metallo-hydrolase [bacterium]
MTQRSEYICETCGTQHAASDGPPSKCRICEDERQYVGWSGQRWTTHARLLRGHTLRIEDDAGVLGFGMRPAFAIDQRAFLLPTDAGNILWEALPIVTPEAVAALEERGGVDMIAVSHPHFYASMVAWSEALGGVPIVLHEADQSWIQRPHPSIELWSGEARSLSDSVTLIRTGGHFRGCTALHWANGPRSGGALFSGDVPQVVMDRRHVSFMYSYPNLIPMRTRDVVALRDRLSSFEFEDVFGYTWGRVIRGGGRAAVDASFERYLAALRDDDGAC